MEFSNESTQKLLLRFTERLGSNRSESDDAFAVAKIHAGNFARSMVNSAAAWDRNCRYNIYNIGDNFLQLIEGFNRDQDQGILQNILVHMLRFALEQPISALPENEKLYVNDTLRFVSENRSWFSKDLDLHISWALQDMTLSIFKHYYYVEPPPLLKDLKDSLKVAETKNAKWQLELLESGGKVQELLDVLNKLKMQTNFGILNNAFSNLRDGKRNEKRWSFGALITLGAVLLMLLGFEFWYIHNYFDDTGWKKQIVIGGIMLAVFASLTYYFRIVLHNFRAIQSQMLQLDLRMALCQFVESYAEFAKGVKNGDRDLLSKFEAVIFSNIVSDETQIPGMHDGVAEISGFMKAVKEPVK